MINDWSASYYWYDRIKVRIFEWIPRMKLIKREISRVREILFAENINAMFFQEKIHFHLSFYRFKTRIFIHVLDFYMSMG